MLWSPLALLLGGPCCFPINSSCRTQPFLGLASLALPILSSGLTAVTLLLPGQACRPGLLAMCLKYTSMGNGRERTDSALHSAYAKLAWFHHFMSGDSFRTFNCSYFQCTPSIDIRRPVGPGDVLVRETCCTFCVHACGHAPGKGLYRVLMLLFAASVARVRYPEI